MSRFAFTPRSILRVMVTGLVGGLVGSAYVLCLRGLMSLLWPTHHAWPTQAIILVTTGVVVALGTRFLGPPGSVELLVDNIHVHGGPEDARRLKSLVPLSLLCIAAGSPMGPEAPLVQTCGTLGAVLGRRGGVSERERRILTLTGMAAAFTVLFGVPIGAAVFALELPHRGELGYGEALVPALLGALCGYGVYVGLTGLGLSPVWTLPVAGPRGAADILWAVGCGALGAAGGLGFVRLHRAVDEAFGRIPGQLGPVLAACGIAGLAALSPAALTFGEGQVDGVTLGHALVWTLLVGVVAKLVAVVLALAGRWPGGFIIPLFFVGFALGRALHLELPAVDAAMLMTAMAAALCSAVTKTPLGATLVVTGMAGMALLPTTLTAAVVALLLSGRTVMIEAQRGARIEERA